MKKEEAAILNQIEREINKLPHWFFMEETSHEFFDTCDIYKLLARLKAPKKREPKRKK